jgi:hypothetical protein
MKRGGSPKADPLDQLDRIKETECMSKDDQLYPTLTYEAISTTISVRF